MTGPELRLTLPVIELDGLRLRPWRVDDAAALVAAWSDPDIIAGSTVPEDRSIDAAARWISGAESRCSRGVAVDLAIAETGADAVVGEVGMSSIDQRRGAALVGWWVAAEARGAGVAGTAVDALAAWALSEAGFTALVAEIAADNTASVHVAMNAGFTPLGPTAWVRRRG